MIHDSKAVESASYKLFAAHIVFGPPLIAACWQALHVVVMSQSTFDDKKIGLYLSPNNLDDLNI